MAVVDHVTNGEIQSNGKFERQANRFVTPFGDKEGELPVEKDRYRLRCHGLAKEHISLRRTQPRGTDSGEHAAG